MSVFLTDCRKLIGYCRLTYMVPVYLYIPSCQEVCHPVLQMRSTGTVGGALTWQHEVEEPGTL